MELKIGDKVRYLDAVGGGIVKAFTGKDMVVILEDDGFETPVLKRQCVVIETIVASAPKQATPKERIQSIQKPSGNDAIVPRKVTFSQPQSREGEMLNVSIAFLPAEGHAFQDSFFESYLVNESNYTLLFQFASCSGKSFTSRVAGTIEPNSKLFLEEFDRGAIAELEKVNIQLLAYKTDLPFALKNPLSVDIRLDTVKFYKIHCFRENPFFDEDALVVSVVKNDVPEKVLLSDPEVLRQAMLEKTVEQRKVSIPLEKKVGPLEIDLHINNLLDTTSGMDTAAILKHQLEVFHDTMVANKFKKGDKIVFIHGKGEGVLRAAIVKLLNTEFRSCKYQDASFKEYGFGATQVTIG